MPARSLADPHCHTTASDGMVSPRELVEAAVSLGLRLIAIADHDTMASADEVWERGGEAGLAVVKGQEVTTAWPAQTHILAWFLERPIPRGRPVEWTVDAIHDQGGLAVIPHPFMPTFFASCQPGTLRRLIEDRTVDGIELLHTAP
ncbi:MAG: PHP domain-containing protein, partial [Candidatus Dormibacteraeota bacterium]|nr:PHP domain-containing protein [Candidatus Dormibacteraeota bacterium]